MNEIVKVLQNLIAWVFKIFAFIWDFTVVNVGKVFALLFQLGDMPMWKAALTIGVVLAAMALIWVLVSEAWDAFRMLINVIVQIFAAFANNLKTLVVLGVLTFGGAWVVNNVDLSRWLS